MRDKKIQLAVIRWFDHSAGPPESGWKSIEDCKKITPIEFMSAGWIVAETKLHVIILPHVELKSSRIDGLCRGEICILKSTILERFEISRFAR